MTITNGSLLIAEPFLGDSNFERSVVLVCEHNHEGTFGLVLNQSSNVTLSDVLDDVYPDFPLLVGGPVQQNTLHFIHSRPDLVDGSVRVMDGLYWSGNFEQVKRAVNVGTLNEQNARFFIGYSGWDAGQLATELKQNTWIVTRTDSTFVFDTPADKFWRSVLKQMGGKFKEFSNYPIDPRLN